MAINKHDLSDTIIEMLKLKGVLEIVFNDGGSFEARQYTYIGARDDYFMSEESAFSPNRAWLSDYKTHWKFKDESLNERLNEKQDDEKLND